MLRIGPDPGQHTNGGCKCLQDLPTKRRIEVVRKLGSLQAEVKRLKIALGEYARETRWFSDREMSVSGSPDKCIYGTEGDGWTIAKEALKGGE